MSFAKIIIRNIGKNISKILCRKYNQRLHADCLQSAKNAFKTTAQKVIQKAAEATGDLIGNKISDKIRKFLITSPQNSSRTVT